MSSGNTPEAAKVKSKPISAVTKQEKRRIALLSGIIAAVIITAVVTELVNTPDYTNSNLSKSIGLIDPTIKWKQVDADSASVLATELPGKEQTIAELRAEIMAMKPPRSREAANAKATQKAFAALAPVAKKATPIKAVRVATKRPQTLISVSEITYMEILDKNDLIVFYGIVRPTKPQVIHLADGDFRIKSQKPFATSVNGRPLSDKPFEITRN